MLGIPASIYRTERKNQNAQMEGNSYRRSHDIRDSDSECPPTDPPHGDKVGSNNRNLEMGKLFAQRRTGTPRSLDRAEDGRGHPPEQKDIQDEGEAYITRDMEEGERIYLKP